MSLLRKKIAFSSIGIFAFIIVIFGFSGCAQKPSLDEVSGLKIVGIQNDKLKLAMLFHINNPSILKIKLKESQFDINYDEKQLASFETEKQFEVSPRNTVEIPVEADMDLALLEKEQGRIMVHDTLDWRVEGLVKYSIYGLSLSSSLDQDVEFNYYDQMQSFLEEKFSQESEGETFSNFSLGDGSSFSKLVVHTDAKLINDNGVGFKIHSMKLGMKLAKKKPIVAEWELEDTLNFNPYDTLLVPIDVNVKTFSLMSNAGLIASKQLDQEVFIEGEMVVEINGHTFVIPLAFEKQIELDLTDLL
jgi:LEA14-like dessication related protein